MGDQDNGVYRDALLGSVDNLSGYYSAPIARAYRVACCPASGWRRGTKNRRKLKAKTTVQANNEQAVYYESNPGAASAPS